MQIRKLTVDDTPAYRELRLAALRDHPLAFTTDYREEVGLSIDEFRARLANETIVTFGAFDAGQLVGLGTLLRAFRLKQQFRATIVGMYVVPTHRGQGIARQLLAACVEHARGVAEIEEVCLCVTEGNDAARRVYIEFGFQAEFMEPRHFKHEGRYFGLEWFRFPLRQVEST